jgi:hypothetical protein
MDLYLYLGNMCLEGKHDVPGESIQVQVQGVQITQVPKNGQPSSFTIYFHVKLTGTMYGIYRTGTVGTGTYYTNINKDQNAQRSASKVEVKILLL